MKIINSCSDNHCGVTVLSNAIRKSSDSNDLILCHQPPTKRFRFQEQPQFSHSTRFKGVVVLPNGLCGSQINAKDHSIWPGTFRSEESDAVAYDRAAIRLRDEDSPCKFPWNRFLLNMNQSTTTAAAITVADEDLADDNKKSSSIAMTAHELFQKELTPSDVGKLNRLVVPKKYAVRYFPTIRMCNDTDLESTDAIDGVEGMMLEFRDREGRRWEFRYCYWRSSQSYVFTKGWSKFVKTKALSAKDTVVFYRCEERGVNVGGRSCNMIEVEYVSQDRDVEWCSTRREGIELRLEEEVVVVEKGERERKGFKLFGVHIS